MRVFNEPFPQINAPFAVSIGKFDGVHIGHRRILDTLLTEARCHGAVSAVYCFEPRNGTPRLTTREEKRGLFESMGVEVLIEVELAGELMAMEPERFTSSLAACGTLKAVAVGQEFRFGKGASGDVRLLRELGRGHGFGVHAVGQVREGGQAVSSTLIRECVKAGEVEKAARLLGREYALSGEVIHGRKLGRELGFKTANLLPPPGKVLPANGVYACWVDVGGRAWPTMTNIGVKPTVDGREMLIESHLIGFEGDLYGSAISVRLVKRIRDEMHFKNLEQLTRQMGRDRLEVMQTLKGKQ